MVVLNHPILAIKNEVLINHFPNRKESPTTPIKTAFVMILMLAFATTVHAQVLSVTGNADITASTVNGAVTLGDTATSAATANTIVKRDAIGNLSAQTIMLSGNLALPSTSGSSAGVVSIGGTPFLHAFGYYNTFVGFSAGNFTMSGSYNVANGYQALVRNTTGIQNTANGCQALYSNTTGNNNTANGVAALYSNVSGYRNTANGMEALYSNTTGHDNTAVGDSALEFCAGSGNIGLGVSGGQSITSGNNNIDIGNSGSSSDSNIIRIGEGQTDTYLAGTVHGTGDPGIVGSSSKPWGNGVYGVIDAANGAGVVAQANVGNAWGLVARFGNDGNHCAYIGTATLAADFYGDVHVNGTASVKVLQILGGADVAEPFVISTKDIPKGAVVVIDDENPGHLRMSDRAYDRRVAGIVSGANGINPGLTLRQQGVTEGGENVALSGQVYALADASNGSIKPGDLLTTSATAGHCMKVVNHVEAQGAILGKAMTGLNEGKGMVLVLVSLQ